MNKTATFKYTFPIAKAEERADGFYITGYASGPEVDVENERMTTDAIEKFSAQINGAPDGDKLVYRDAHAPDGVLRDLGDITKAWVNEHFHLGIEVKLNMDNPAAAFLFKSINKGKQYGMSIAGRVNDYIDEFVEGSGIVRTYKDVSLDEISNTTRPAWYPSFGTVLAKSIKDASSTDADLGETLKNEGLLDETVVEETTEKSGEDLDIANAPIVDETGEDDDVSTDKSADESTDDTEVAKAGRKVSGATAAKLIGLYESMGEELRNLGVLESTEEETTSEKAASGTEEDITEKTGEVDATADTITKSDLDALVSELAKANERIATLEATPRTQLPGVINDATRKSALDEYDELLSKASPAEKLRVAFAAQTGGA